MKIHSLAMRLILLACLSIGLALSTIAFILSGLFSQYFEDRVYSELAAQLDQLTANLTFMENGDLEIAPMLDPRFQAPFSGLYWQAVREDHPKVVSRSLWTGSIDIRIDAPAGELIRSALVSPLGEPLLVLGRAVKIGDEASESLVELTVAVDQSEVQRAAANFRSTMISWLGIIFFGLFAASWVQVKLGLAPLEALRKKVERVRSGKDFRLEGDFPSEVQPLANEVNELLDLHEVTLSQARERASDLAHGLKTPLTIINTIAHDLRKNGELDAAAEIDSQIASMNHFIGRELARVRTRTAGTSVNMAYPVAEKMLEAIKRFPRRRPLLWELDMPADFTTPFDEHDLSELLGNLLDNSRKWAKTRVRLAAGKLKTGRSYLSVEDDGVGVEKSDLLRLGRRGQRLDPSAQGSGLGLAICSDLAAHYGAEIRLQRSELGGLKVTIIWG